MRVYAETNFILEMAFEQDQSASCEALLVLAEQKRIKFALPSFSFTEPHGRLRRQNHERGELQKRLGAELREFGRSSRTTEEQKKAWATVSGMLVSSTQDAEQRLDSIRSRLLGAACILPLTSKIIGEAASGVSLYGLHFPDALVLASVLSDLDSNAGQEHSCFVNANSRDFEDPAVMEALSLRKCKLISRFDAGLSYVQAALNRV